MEYTKGQVVYSKCGRDRGMPFIVISAEGQWLYLADGKLRKLSKPKRKKSIHVQKTKVINDEIKEKLECGGYILDADIAKALKEYSNG